jgi:rubrerythrin
VRLDEVSKLMDTPCAEGRRQDEVEQKREGAEKVEARVCEYCGKPADAGMYPIEYVGGSPLYLALCSDCAKKIEEMYVVARPNIVDRTGKRLLRCKHPLEGVRRVAWNSYTKTWFVADKEGRWPCPACGVVHDRLLDAIKHFVEKHPDLPRSGREYVAEVGEVWKTWQGHYCPICGLLCDLKTLREHHYESHHRG